MPRLCVSGNVAAADFLQYALGGSFNSSCDFGSETDSGAEVTPLNPIHDDSRWKPVQGPAEFDRLGYAECVG